MKGPISAFEEAEACGRILEDQIWRTNIKEIDLQLSWSCGEHKVFLPFYQLSTKE
jgi:hypothetical protein